jgi:hypothetical protein
MCPHLAALFNAWLAIQFRGTPDDVRKVPAKSVDATHGFRRSEESDDEDEISMRPKRDQMRPNMDDCMIVHSGNRGRNLA